MKQCTGCGVVKPIEDYSPQKKNPKKLYAWCNACRKPDAVYIKGLFSKEEKEQLRAATEKQRKMTDAQVVEAKSLYTGGMKIKDIANKFGVNPDTARKYILHYTVRSK